MRIIVLLVILCAFVSVQTFHNSTGRLKDPRVSHALAMLKARVKRKKVERVRQQGDTIEEINEKAGVDGALFQGDILLTRKQANEILNDIVSRRRKRQAYRDDWYPSTIWENDVYYHFAPYTDNKIKRIFRKAVELWRRDTCVNFREEEHPTGSIMVFEGQGCWSVVGKVHELDKQKISLGEDCDEVHIAAHELGHTLGFVHTHARHDRDEYITVVEKNVKNDWSHNFVKEGIASNDNYDLPYDYGSIMHYESTCGSRDIDNNLITMLPKEPLYVQTLGSPFVSFIDLQMMNKHYKCKAPCDPEEAVSCENHGFVHPRNCSRCVCPGGYGGDRCDELPDNCGDLLLADIEPKEFTAVVEETNREDFNKCTYMIKAPHGTRAVIELVEFGPDHIASEGCTYGGVEIKAQEDQRLTGYRFCSQDDSKTEIISKTELVPIIIYNRHNFTSVTIRYHVHQG
ncbi:hypothetical protein Q1695_011311 [Nippostrongylus brasiliensis]|nr:hypothetical protein Q1695_011311 [Nippostrongylus brasiliensis]